MKANNISKQDGNDALSFEEAVNSISDLAGGYCEGLKALKADSSKIKPKDLNCLSGSVDIDLCTKRKYPDAARWDFAVGYEEKAYFVEVHPANTSNIKEMLKKVDWLKSWLGREGKALDKIKKGQRLYWVPSGKVAISRTSPQFRYLAKYNLCIEKCPFILE